MMIKTLPEIRSHCVVLERIAWGAGQTRWYVAYDAQQLGDILSGAANGSAISCYFDDRLKRSTWSMSTRQEIMDVVKTSGDCVVARPVAGSNLLDVAFVAGENDIDEFFPAIREGETVFLGAFPGRDDDGVNAVSWIVPDSNAPKRIPH
jgi:hypothetical protein